MIYCKHQVHDCSECQPSPQQEPSVEIMCPNCGNVCDIATERRPNGDSECSFCGHRGTTQSFSVPRLESRISALQSQLLKAEAELERERMRLAACGVAAMQNTKDSHGKNQVDKDSPYYSASYADVCAAVDREMSLMVQLKASEERAGRLEAKVKLAQELVKIIDIEGPAILAWERASELCKALALDAKRGEV